MAQPEPHAGAPLQPFSHELSTYERVERPWVCGRRAQGRPCELGPDRKGRCSLMRPGAREASQLDESAIPCRPRRSTRARRGLVSRVSVLIVLGALLTALASGWSERLISPGELSGVHHHIADCARCHSGSESIFEFPVLSTGKDGCLGCHLFENEEHIRSPHSLSAAELKERVDETSTTPAGSAPVMMRVASVFGQAPEQAAGSCTGCHAEHRGLAASPTTVDDARCQTCHTGQFASFAEGHPEFQHYPHHHRRTRIAFDHGVHFRDWFTASRATGAGGSAAPRCSTCHTVEPDGKVMGILGFDAMCGVCHGADVAGPDQRPVVLLAIPAPATEVDPETGRERLPSDLELAAGLLETLDGEPAALADALIAGLDETLRFPALSRLQDPPAGLADRAREIARTLMTSEAPWSALGLAENLSVEIGVDGGAAAMARLVLRPRGHGDELLARWLPVMLDALAPEQLGTFLRAGPSAVTGCLKCHTADRDENGATEIRWKGRSSRNSARDDLVSFLHAPHLRETLEFSWRTESAAAEPCMFCHRMHGRQEAEGWLPASSNLHVLDDGSVQWESPLGDFQGIGKGTCLTCHNEVDTAATCLTCHRYHAGKSSLVSGSSSR